MNRRLSPCCLQEAGEALFMSEQDVREAREEAHRELVKDESTAEEREVSSCSLPFCCWFPNAPGACKPVHW